ncbi:MAG: pseudouridine synthase, partial [Methanomicrobiales archaeon]|nr:pseudouridine synthase [Methanomicrobiales archaeon]
MKGVEILSRDGTARYGRLTVDDTVMSFPSATDTTRLFPALNTRTGTNIPPIEDPEFVSRFLVRDGEQPIPLHIHAPADIQSGDTVITPN